jgi:hypothetical protein
VESVSWVSCVQTTEDTTCHESIARHRKMTIHGDRRTLREMEVNGIAVDTPVKNSAATGAGLWRRFHVRVETGSARAVPRRWRSPLK